MTPHERMLELAISALDFPLEPDDQRLVSEHLAACETCRNQVSALRADHERLAAAQALRAPALVRERVLAAALDTGSTPLFQRPLLVLATALLLVALAVGGVAVGARLLEFILDSRLPVPTAGPALPSGGAATASAAASVAPSAVPELEWMGYRQVVVDVVPMRAQARAGSEVLAELPADTIVSAWNAPLVEDGDEWQLVHYGDLVGWVPLATPVGDSLGDVELRYPSPLLRVDIYPDVIGPLGTLTFAVYGDGRLIRPDADGYGWTEQVLTSAGIELLDTTARESGLFQAAASYPPAEDWEAGFTTTRISVLGWNGPVAVMATNASDQPAAEVVIALGEQLVALVDSLPDDAFVDPDVPLQAHLVPAYNLLIGFSQGVLETWPADQVTAIPLWLEDADLPLDQPLLETGELVPGQDLRCSVIDAAAAASLREALWAAGYEEMPGSDALASFTLGWRATNGVITLDINAVPPGDAADCVRYGAEPVGTCVDAPDLAALLDVADPVGCYGDADLVLEGWLAFIGAYDPVLFTEPEWLCCPYHELHADESTAQAGMGLWVVASPGRGITLDEFTETRVSITGHFDDPAAQDCQYTEDYSHLGVLPADAVIGCRRTFVVTELAIAGG